MTPVVAVDFGPDDVDGLVVEWSGAVAETAGGAVARSSLSSTRPAGCGGPYVISSHMTMAPAMNPAIAPFT
jgi:hypothetical protein